MSTHSLSTLELNAEVKKRRSNRILLSNTLMDVIWTFVKGLKDIWVEELLQEYRVCAINRCICMLNCKKTIFIIFLFLMELLPLLN